MLCASLCGATLAQATGAPQAPLTGKGRDAFLKKVEQRMAKVRTVVARFAQQKHLALFGDVVKTSGCILYARPDQLRWEIRQPFRSILIVAGRDVAKFEFHKGKRRRLELGRSSDIILMVMNQIRGWFRGDFARSMQRYDVRVFAPTEKRTARIELRPKDKNLARNLQRIELRFAKTLTSIERVTIFERGSDQTVMDFTKLRDNPVIAKDYFDVRAPREFDPAAFEKPTSRPRKRATPPKQPR